MTYDKILITKSQSFNYLYESYHGLG